MVLRYGVFLFITLASGAAALSHELLWTRRLVDILGATGQATSLVLGCFFFGLSVGAAVVSRRVDGLKNPWKSLALLELTIAVLTLPAAFLPQLTEWIWPTLGPELLVSWLGQLVKLAISALVVLPPAIAMGMTLPILIVAVDKQVTTSRNAKITIYAFNTLGGACGLLVTSVWLLEALGVFGCMIAAMSANLLVAGIAWSMQSAQLGSSKRRRDREASSEIVDFSAQSRLAIAAFSGFSVLALEVVAIRLLSLVVHSSFQATSSLLLSVILMLGLAALLIPAIRLIVKSPQLLVVMALSLSAIGSALAPQLLLGRTRQLVNVPVLAAMNGETLSGILDFQMSVLSIAMVAIGPTIFVAGLVFPVVFASVPREAASGRHLAMLLAVNGLGGLLGAVFADYVLLPSFGIYGGMLAMGATQAIAAFAVAVAAKNWKLSVPGVAAFAACLLLVSTTARLPYVSPKSRSRFEIENVAFGKDGVCLVTTTKQHGRGILMNNQYLLGSTIALEDQRRQVLLPLLLHNGAARPDGNQDSKNICCLGLATGMSAGAALDFDDDCQVTAIELSPMVVDAARDHFREENNAIVTDPRATIIVEDARTYISAVKGQFDVIAGDLYRPYGAGRGSAVLARTL